MVIADKGARIALVVLEILMGLAAGGGRLDLADIGLQLVGTDVLGGRFVIPRTSGQPADLYCGRPAGR